MTRTCLGFLALMTLTAPCVAIVTQYTFGRHDFPTGHRPSAVVIADVNHDGREDLVVANQGENTVSVFLGLANGVFAARKNFPTADGPTAVVAADFNHDGKLDLAVVAIGGNVVSILLGNGNGTFSEPINYQTGQTPLAITMGDFNHDGNVDLAVVNNCSCANNVSVLLGNADGSFKPKTDYPVGAAPLAIATYDLNGDGNLDLAVANSGDTSISILLGNANGTFKPSIDAPTQAGSCGIAIGDFDGDKIPDLVVTHQDAPWALTVMKGNGDGTFQAEQQISQLASANQVQALDINGDGKIDLVLPVVFQGGALVLLGNGNGTFQTPVAYATGTYAYSLAIQDLNGDGNFDLAVVDQESNYLTVLLGNGDGTFGPRRSLPSAPNDPSKLTAVASAIGDFNNDGVPDLVLSEEDSGGVSVLLGAGKGKFHAPVFTDSSGALSITTADFNEDGHLDVAVANGSGAAVLFGGGNGRFAAPFQVLNTQGTPARGLVAGDFNNDGHQDLVVLANGFTQPNPIYVFLGKGDRTFQGPKQFWSSSTVPMAIASGDFNHDGRLDLVVAVNPNGIAVMLGNGDGTFQSPVSYSTDQLSGGLTVADVNGDDIPDILVTTSDFLNVFLGKGDGTFAKAVHYAAGNFPGQVITGDFNGDGILDIATAAQGSAALGDIEILLGSGGGKFAHAVEIASPASYIGPLTAGDLNQDGTSDLVAAGGSLFLSGPLATVSPTLVNFGTIRVGHMSAARIVTVTNDGTGALEISAVTTTRDYKVVSDTCGRSVEPRSTCTLKIELSPTVSGDDSGSLTFIDSAPGGKQVVSLSGRGAVLPGNARATDHPEPASNADVLQ
jgi:hypothetical protein